MRIVRLIWAEDRIEHIARHAVTPAEVEEVCFGRSLVLRARSQGENPVYYCLGQTAAGRYLFCVVIEFPRWQWVSGRRPADDDQRRTPVSKMESKMKKLKLPKTDSIQKLAEFWDRHDLADYWDQTSESKFEVDLQRRVFVTALEPELAKKLANPVRRKASTKKRT